MAASTGDCFQLAVYIRQEISGGARIWTAQDGLVLAAASGVLDGYLQEEKGEKRMERMMKNGHMHSTVRCRNVLQAVL